MTGAHHERVRRAVLPLFGRRRLEPVRPRIRAMAEELIDTMAAESVDGTADLVASYVERLPLRVLCETTGLPHEDRDIYLPHALTLLGASGVPMAEVLASLYALQDYATALIDRKEQEDAGEDYIRLLLARSRAPGSDLTRDDVVSFVVTMLMAGDKTTMQHTGNALLALLTHPGALRRLRAEPSGIGASTCPGRPTHTSRSGTVPHACTGGHLTRLQLATAIQVLLERLPGIELAVPVDSIRWDESTPLRAPAQLRVRW